MDTSIPGPPVVDNGEAEVVASLQVTGLTPSRLVATDGSKILASVADLTAWVAGTSNQVTVANDGDGTITVSLPSAITTPGSLTVTGHILPQADNTYDLGSSSFEFRSVYVGTHVAITGSFSGASLVVPNGTAMRTGSAGTSYFFDLGSATFRNGDGSSSNASITVYGTFNLSGEVTLVSDGANILAQKNSTAAQTFRVYGTTTGPRYFFIAHDGSSVQLDVVSDITSVILLGGNAAVIRFVSSLDSYTDNGFDVGGASNRFRSIYWGTQALGPNGTAGAPAYSFASQPTWGLYTDAANGIIFSFNGGVFAARGSSIELINTATLAWSSGALFAGQDLLLSRGGAGILVQGNGANAQEFRVYGHAANAKYISVSHDGTDAYCITSSGRLGLGPSATVPWLIQTTGHFFANADNTYDVGASGANRPRSIYVGTAFRASDGVLATPSYAFASQTDFGFRYITTNFMALVGSSVNLTAISSLGITQRNGQYIGWTSGDNATAAPDVILEREDAGILRLMNGANPQSFYVYGNSTTPSLIWMLHNGPDYGEIGVSPSNQYLQFTIHATQVCNVDSTGFYPNADNTYDLGGDTLGWKHVFIADGSALAPSISRSTGANPTGFFFLADSVECVALNSFDFYPSSARGFVAGFSYDYTGLTGGVVYFGDNTDDCVMGRVSSGVIGQARSTNPQEFRVYGSTTGPVYVALAHTGSSASIGTNNGGGSLHLVTGGSSRWIVGGTTGHLTANSNNVYDIGASGATSPRSIYWGTQAFGPNGSVSAPSHSFTNETNTGMYTRLGTVTFAVLGVGAFEVQQNVTAVCRSSSPTLGFLDGPGGNTFTLLVAGTNILEQKNTTNAQEFRVYGTTTGPKYTYIWTDGTDTYFDVNSGTTTVHFGTTGAASLFTGLRGEADNTYDLGTSGVRWRVIYAGTGVAAGTNPAATGAFRSEYDNGFTIRNQANNGDMVACSANTINGVTDVMRYGLFSSGCLFKARSGGAAPTTSDLAAGEWCLWRDTGGGTTKLYYNNAGAIQSVTLT